jgi:putative flippase GtrA
MTSAPASSRLVALDVTTPVGLSRASGVGTLLTRAGRLSALIGLVRFGLVGLSGMVVNLVVLTALLRLPRSVPATTAQAVAETVATQVAIVWNFALTEGWVFRRTHAPVGRLRRFAGFWAVCMVALAVQLPLSSLLDAAFGIGYVVATSAALAILVVARFALCRAVLYRGAAGPTKGGLQ